MSVRCLQVTVPVKEISFFTIEKNSNNIFKNSKENAKTNKENRCSLFTLIGLLSKLIVIKYHKLGITEKNCYLAVGNKKRACKIKNNHNL